MVAIIILGLAQLAYLVALVCLHGLVISTLWTWFIVASFAAPAITVPVAIGLSLMVTYVIGGFPAKSKKNFVDILYAPLLVLCFGYIVHLFV